MQVKIGGAYSRVLNKKFKILIWKSNNIVIGDGDHVQNYQFFVLNT